MAHGMVQQERASKHYRLGPATHRRLNPLRHAAGTIRLHAAGADRLVVPSAQWPPTQRQSAAASHRAWEPRELGARFDRHGPPSDRHYQR